MKGTLIRVREDSLLRGKNRPGKAKGLTGLRTGQPQKKPAEGFIAVYLPRARLEQARLADLFVDPNRTVVYFAAFFAG
jgi:hypothetical protein